MGKAADAGKVERFRDLNYRFHELIFDAAANARLREMDLAVRNEMQLYIRDNIATEAQLQISHVEHTAIVNALEASDAGACSSAFERHILNGKQRLIDSAPRSRRSR